MKHRHYLSIGLAALAGIALVSTASAAVTIDWVTVGDAGNAADSTGYGAVGYDYEIGKYEVTTGQYTEFLNAKAKTDTYSLYNTQMETNPDIAGISRSGSSGSYSYSVISSSNIPVTFVSWFDAARFCNWLSNGQGDGDTETGAYALNGAMSGVSFTASADAQYRLPTEDEWYKAAYYDPSATGPADDYWLYPTRSDSTPSNDLPDAGNNANFDQLGYTQSGTNKLTDVGTFASSDSYYGTFDQGGNAFEWNDSVIGSSRGRRGGSWFRDEFYLQSTNSNNVAPSNQSSGYGFRLATVPEPSSVLMVGLGGMAFLARRRRPAL